MGQDLSNDNSPSMLPKPLIEKTQFTILLSLAPCGKENQEAAAHSENMPHAARGDEEGCQK
jgi:hypothetical protein